MVLITPEAVARCKKMFIEQYGVEYSEKEAWEATNNLLGAFDLLLQMDRRQHPENYKKWDSEKQAVIKQNYGC